MKRLSGLVAMIILIAVTVASSEQAYPRLRGYSSVYSDNRSSPSEVVLSHYLPFNPIRIDEIDLHAAQGSFDSLALADCVF